MPGKIRNRICAALLAALLLFALPAGAGYATLRPGSSGEDVLRLQRALISLGYSVTADGYYGTGTWNAVTAFQRDHGLNADGLAGNATLTQLYALADRVTAQTPQQAADVPPAAVTELRPGSSGTEVRILQNQLAMLGYLPDGGGIFGTATQRALREFQNDFGLPATGWADSATIEKLQLTAQGITETAFVTAPGATLALRSSRSTLSGIVGYVANGSTVGVMEHGTTWSMVRYHSMKGYLPNSSLTFSGAVAAATATPAPAWGNLARVQTSGGSLTLRASQSTLSAALAYIPNGQTVQVLQRGTSWCRVTYAGLTGYVTTRYLYFLTDTVTAPPTPAPTAAPATEVPGAYARVIGGRLNLRSAARSNAASLTMIPNGATVTVLARGIVWTQVRYNGTVGYVMSQYLDFGQAQPVTARPAATMTPTPRPTATPAPQAQSEYARVTGGRLILRSRPSSVAGALVVIPDGTYLRVLSPGVTWTRVTYGDYTGYVMTQYLVFIENRTATPRATVTPRPTATAAPRPTAAPAVTPAPGASGTAVVSVSSGGVNLRSYASTSASVLRSIPNGTRIQVLARGQVWSEVSYGGTVGYVMNQYLIFDGGWETPAPTAAPVVTAPPSSSGYDTSILTRTLRSGYTGQDVIYLQQRLRDLKYLSAVTGTYDSETMEAVKQFQRVHGLTQDGIAGPKTFTALFAASAQPYSDTLDSYATLRIYYGSDSTADSGAVTKLQKALSQLGYAVNATGKFDELTHNAVVQFQMRNGLTPTGAADAATQRILYSGRAQGATAAPFLTVGAGENIMSVPPASQINLLHWYNVVKPSVQTGATLKVLDPNTGTWWNLKVYSRGRHCDSEPLTLRDTLLMNRAFGKTGWTVHVVYVQLPDGRWTMATMHNRPHLNGSISDNGFDGHLCVHFLRDMDECRQYDPDYGVTNQTTLREAWEALTGIRVE